MGHHLLSVVLSESLTADSLYTVPRPSLIGEENRPYPEAKWGIVLARECPKSRIEFCRRTTPWSCMQMLLPNRSLLHAVGHNGFRVLSGQDWQQKNSVRSRVGVSRRSLELSSHTGKSV